MSEDCTGKHDCSCDRCFTQLVSRIDTAMQDYALAIGQAAIAFQSAATDVRTLVRIVNEARKANR